MGPYRESWPSHHFCVQLTFSKYGNNFKNMEHQENQRLQDSACPNLQSRRFVGSCWLLSVLKRPELDPQAPSAMSTGQLTKTRWLCEEFALLGNLSCPWPFESTWI